MRTRVSKKFRVAATLLLIAAWTPAGFAQVPAQDERIRIVRRTLTPEIMTYRQSLPEGPPALRGFKAPILDNAEQTWGPTLPNNPSPEIQQAADIVSRRLASDGLLTTLTRIIGLWKPRLIAEKREECLDMLRQAGFPVDLLAHFPIEGAEPANAFSTIVDITRRFGDDQTADEVAAEVAAWTMRYQQSRRGFHVATDSGEQDFQTLRLQVSTDHYYKGVGDGSNFDVVRQLIAALPDPDFLISIQDKHVDPFLAVARSWPLTGRATVTLLPEPLPVGQWAQDNAKPGFVEDQSQASAALLVPRYASRREEATMFVPGESFLIDSLAALGQVVIQSPLLFQGGNLLAIRDPKSGQRILLIGEAEIYRNVALGLTAEQVLEAFRVEFGVDQCVVLPAISYHIDYEVAVRTTPGGLVAFVNDSAAASRFVLQTGIDALSAHRVFDEPTTQKCRELLSASRLDDVLEIVESVMVKRSVAYGRFPLSFARNFEADAVDSGVANLQRFLLAVDYLAFARSDNAWRPPDPHSAAYARSLVRREADRAEQRQKLAALGCKVIPIPSTSEADRSLNYLNGLHGKDTYFLPAYGGLYADLDRAAISVFQQVLGPSVRVIPILCGESQRRHGAVRCSVTAYPKMRDKSAN